MTTPNSESYLKPLQTYTSLRFRANNIKNLFHEPSDSNKPITMLLSLFPIWTFTNDIFYYNFIKNKDKGSAKRKVTFRQTLIIQSSSTLSEKEKLGSRYQTQYQVTRSNNSSEKSSDDDDDNDNNDSN